jgi:hypothetical protein
MLGNVGKENHLGAGRIRLNWSRNIERKEKGEVPLYKEITRKEEMKNRQEDRAKE